jgi:hypothetical protein
METDRGGGETCNPSSGSAEVLAWHALQSSRVAQPGQSCPIGTLTALNASPTTVSVTHSVQEPSFMRRFIGPRRCQRRGALTLEWILLVTVIVIGIIGGLGLVRNATVGELRDLAEAIEQLNVEP